MKFFALSLCFLAFIFSEFALADYPANKPSVVKKDEDVIFFPSIAYPLPGDSRSWKLEIRGWVFEPEFESIKRRLLLKAFCHSLGLLDEDCNTELFKNRAKYFLVDNERGKSIQIQVAGHKVISAPSGKEGHFRADLEISEAEMRNLQAKTTNNWLPLEAVSGLGDSRIFSGKIFLLKNEGVAVISDIDDTIKESSVSNKSLLLKNTFTRPFKAFPKMVELYQSLEKDGATFHYITASPWQLYPALSTFVKESDYPNGTFNMKEFRWKDSRFFDLFTSPKKLKIPIIESFIKIFPNKKFILIGDSGEKDPEIYAEIVRRFPQNDIQIIIRESPDLPMSSERSLKAFDGIKQERWKIVRD